MAEDNSKICAILLYVFWLVGIIWYFVDPEVRKNHFATFHAKQSIVLVIASIVWSILYGVIIGILGLILFRIPFIGLIFAAILQLGFLIPIIFVVIGLIHVLKDEQKELPLIGKFADKFKL